MTLIGWQFGNAAGVFLTGSLIQSITVLYRPEDAALMWRTVVIMIPCLAFVIMVNVYGARAIATVQNLSMSVHILALIAIVGKCCCVIYLWPRTDH
jgi:choline transport protein